MVGGNVALGTKLTDQIGDLLGLQQLIGLDVLRMHLALLIGQTIDVHLDVLQAGVHKSDVFLSKYNRMC